MTRIVKIADWEGLGFLPSNKKLVWGGLANQFYQVGAGSGNGVKEIEQFGAGFPVSFRLVGLDRNPQVQAFGLPWLELEFHKTVHGSREVR
jgi:hypothetical protein